MQTHSTTTRSQFERDGFVIAEATIGSEQAAVLRQRFERLFAGEFETGVYPDEWHWRQGLSRDDAPRHMTNAWKSDLEIARLALSEPIAATVSELTGWSDVRLGQDSIWWKTPQSGPVAYHQDTSFMDFLQPRSTMTCWVTLDDTVADGGTLEYARGSHRWPLHQIPNVFATQSDFRAPLRAAAAAAGELEPDLCPVIVEAGSSVFHSGEIWHGSGPNHRVDRHRRSIGLHFLPATSRFTDGGGGYIYRRYQRTGCDELDDSFFPIVFSKTGRRTAWIDSYLATGRRAIPAEAAA